MVEIIDSLIVGKKFFLLVLFNEVLNILLKKIYCEEWIVSMEIDSRRFYVVFVLEFDLEFFLFNVKL